MNGTKSIYSDRLGPYGKKEAIYEKLPGKSVAALINNFKCDCLDLEHEE